jgi:hypothetical protein
MCAAYRERKIAVVARKVSIRGKLGFVVSGAFPEENLRKEQTNQCSQTAAHAGI